MRQRYWVWVVVRLGLGVAIVAWAASYLTSGSGEKEFQKTLDALKQVHTFRVAFTANPANQHNEMLWEVDCNRDLLHYQWHVVQTNGDATSDMSRDELHVAGLEYDRGGDGSWTLSKYQGSHQSAKAYCTNIGQDFSYNLMPPIATMIKRGILQKGDKKTVNGVRCREWLVTMKGGVSGLEHDTVCIGVEDHLPYELTVDWAASRSLFSDYNSPIQLNVPDAALQPASASAGTN